MTPNRSSAAATAPSTDFAVALLSEFVRLGLRDVVLSPGSRSQALALAAAEFERRGHVRLRVRIDERVAGFLALGLAVETARPVLIITTSGTAVANLHPAVLEAHHSGVPLIVVSADRPEQLRGIGSNQTAEQPGIFGPAIGHTWDIAAPVGDAGEADVAAHVARESWSAANARPRGHAGPVHLNLSFAEPLSGAVVLPHVPTAAVPAGDGAPAPSPFGGAQPSPPSLVLIAHPRTVVVAGAGAGETAESVARALGAPLVAEVSSGSHFGPNLVVAYRELLNSADFGGQVERVIVFGHPTLSREVPALIQREGVSTIVVRTPGADDYNPGHRVAQVVDSVRVAGAVFAQATDLDAAQAARAAGSAPEARAWLGRWVATSRALLEVESPDGAAFVDGSEVVDGSVPPPVDLDNAAFARRQLAIVREPVTRRMLVEAVWRATWPHDRLVLGASRLIREADRFVAGKKISVHSNRGLAGIDGTIATALGIALASQGEPAAKFGGDGAPTAERSAESSAVATAAARRMSHQPDPRAGTTRVLLGDLAALHDSGALAFGMGEIRPRIQVIVGNDGGGTIFDGLEVAATAPSSALDRVLLTGQRVDFGKLAEAFGWGYLRVRNRGELDEALASSADPILIEVPLAR